MRLVISKQTARRYLLLKQLLLPPKSLIGEPGIEKVFKTLRAIQYDPLNICSRNTDLVLQSRVKGIHPNDYYDWLYKKRKGVESYDKELCIVPVEDIPFCVQMSQRAGGENRYHELLKNHEKDVNKLLKSIAQKGSICSSDIKDRRRVDIFWSEESWGKAILDTLWRVGKLVITKREKGRKYYDLPLKVYGSKFKLSENTVLNTEHVLRRLNSVGILPKSGTGSGWLGVGTGAQILPIVNKMIHDNKANELVVSGSKRTYICFNDEKLLKKAQSLRITKQQVSFIAPLDNLLWDRQMIGDIFDFDYRWEVYFQKQLRKFGYYVLPVLYGDNLIGRIEPIFKNNTLEIKGLWFEDNFKEDSVFEKAFNQGLEDFRKFLGAERTIIS